jgi:hypothetical protein
MGAEPMGIPGCPEFAFSTLSTASMRMVFTQSSSTSITISSSLIWKHVFIAKEALIQRPQGITV